MMSTRYNLGGGGLLWRLGGDVFDIVFMLPIYQVRKPYFSCT